MEHHKQDTKQIQWQPLIELTIVLVTILGSTIPLYLHTDAKLHAALHTMNEEMKDFHERLCSIEKEKR